jgi:hypothetical protein
MADGNGKNQQGDETVLVAWVTVHLETGESFELLPFEDAQDVKSKVSDLMREWAGSGFLIRGSQIIPWHRVQRLEATSVDEPVRSESRKRQEEWQAKETARLQQSFWKTRQPREKKEEGEEGDAGKQASRRTAA